MRAFRGGNKHLVLLGRYAVYLFEKLGKIIDIVNAALLSNRLNGNMLVFKKLCSKVEPLFSDVLNDRLTGFAVKKIRKIGWIQIVLLCYGF